MAHQFKSLDETIGYLFDIALRKGKKAAEAESFRIYDSIPVEQLEEFSKRESRIYRDKNIPDDKGIGDEKLAVYRKAAQVGEKIDYNKKFLLQSQPKAQPKPTQAPPADPKPVAKEVAKPAPKPSAKTKTEPMENERGFRPFSANSNYKDLLKIPSPESEKQGDAPKQSMSNLLSIKADKPASNSRQATGGSTLKMPAFVPKK